MTQLRPTPGYANVNGVRMYYERYGQGKPLVLIHGGFGVTTMFLPLLPGLAAQREVIAVELQGHGHTADTDRPFSYEAFADDIAALIHDLDLGQADVMGYSLGGGVALQTAIRHPERVHRLLVLSAPACFTGWYPEVRAGMASLDADQMRATFLFDVYKEVAPHVEHWDRLIAKTRDLLSAEYDWSAQVAAIAAPTLLVFGDSDSLSPAYAAEMLSLFGNQPGAAPRAQLGILPGAQHWDVVSRPGVLLPMIDAFLAPPPVAT